MRKKIYLALILIVFCIQGFSQAPEKFNYQAVIRNSSNDLIINQDISIKVSILDEISSTTALYSEEHSVSTNAYGVVNLEVGNGTLPSGTFSLLNWESGDKFLKIEIDENGGSTYIELGAVQLLSVPYALFANSADNLGDENIYSPTTDTLFVVKDYDGNVVFAVFPDGAVVYVNETAKGKVGGFAVSGRTSAKGIEEEYLRITADSTRIYVNEIDPVKGKVGGFAVSGRTSAKGIINDYLFVTGDSTRVYVNDSTLTKGKVGGFAVSGRTSAKGEFSDYLQVTRDSTRIYINESEVKGKVGGFAVSGRTSAKVGTEKDYFNISANTAAEIINNEARIMWYPEKSAFMAGEVHVGSADSVGTNSTALGYRNIAMGNWSQAFGFQSQALGDYSIAIGNQATAFGPNSFAFGDSAYAGNENSYALGNKAIASGYGSFAMGSKGTDLFYEGMFTEASGDHSIAFGLGAKASNFSSVAIGTNVTSSGYNSVVFGSGCVASGENSTAFGLGSHATNTAAIAMGLNSYAADINSIAIGYGNSAVGIESVSIGSHNDANGDYSFILGSNSFTSAYMYGISIGYDNTSDGTGAIAIGRENTSVGNSSFTAGYKSSTSNSYAVAMGYMSQAIGMGSVAIGKEAIASGGTSISSVSIGNQTTASGGTGATALGYNSTASGITSFAFGNASTASGANSTSLGYGIKVSGAYSFGIALNNQFGTDVSQANTMAILGGKVGIGTTSPTEELHVNGNIRIDGEIRQGVSDYGAYEIQTPGQIYTNDYLVAMGGLHVGGTSDPGTDNLRVDGTSYINYISGTLGVNWTNNGTYGLVVSGGSSSSYSIFAFKGGYTSGSWVSGSDIKFKKNITPLVNVLEKLKKINGVNFNWKVDEFPDRQFDNLNQIGVIAQDVEIVFPELVSEDGEGYKAVAYDKLTAVLVEAVKEQQTQIEDLKSENEDLKNRLTEIEKLLITK